MDKQLKPCPFCGHNAGKYLYDPFDGYQETRITYIVKCVHCCANVERTTMEEAIEAWNRRVNNG